MSLLVVCPLGAAIADVTIDNCPSDVGQVIQLFFQRYFSTGTTRNSIAAADAPTLGTWTPLFAAADGTKIQKTPDIGAPENEPGAPIKYGGGNDTPFGVQLTTGYEPSKFSCKLLRCPSKTITGLKALQGETLGVWLVNEHSRIWGDSDDAETPTIYYPIKIRELTISDRKLGGKNEPDYYMMEFWFEPAWSDRLNEIIPTFDPLTALAN